MTERWARVEEHLKNAVLYERPHAAEAGEAWKRRLLARHGGAAVMLDADGPQVLRILIIFIPLVLLVLLMVISIWNFYTPPAGAAEGPAGWLRLSMQLLDIQLPAFNLWIFALIGAGVAGLTFLARGRLPNFLPLDW